MFDGLDDDDDDVPVNVGTAVPAADPATYDGFDGLGVEIVDGVPVVTDQDDEADTPHVIDKSTVED